MLGVDDAVLGAGRHPGPTDQMRVALDRDDLLGAGRAQDVFHDATGGLDQLLVVVALAVGEVSDRKPVAVLFVGQGDPVGGLRQQFTQRAQGGPMHVVAHILPQRGTPMSLCANVFCPGDRQGADGLDGPAAFVGFGRVGLVELLGGNLGWRRLVHPDLVAEPSGDLRCALHHQVAAELVVLVAESAIEALSGRQQQQPRRLDRVAGDDDRAGPLAPDDAGVEVLDAGGAAGAVVDKHP